MRSKKYILTVVALVIGSLLLAQGGLMLSTQLQKQPQTESAAIQSVGDTIAASGSIHSENETTLHFQMGGTVIYLPCKVGDSVSAGQTIAQLDPRAIQDSLNSALAAANSQQQSFNTTNDKNGDRPLTDTGLSTSALRELQTAANTLTQAQLTADIQKIALEQATLTAPFSGTITAEDITSSGVNVTPLTSFSLADPTKPVFRANVAADEVDFLTVGAQAEVILSGTSTPITATVEKVYPQQTVVNGENVYQVDVTSPQLARVAKLGQSGVSTIKSSVSQKTALVPTWTILNHSSVWVLENNKPVLKKVTVGKAHADKTEILDGLTTGDRVIINPQAIAAERYTAL